ncbi:MAG: UDP-N-acetylglucosamine 2-epimerase (non-hydrolyzing) [Thermaerobacter sp.]|nr:UDP-N-acetylglucosamine 2-epimerase (non-hydrolyzing) [Thermaerobacter sp.]
MAGRIKVLTIFGVRPEAIKMAPVVRELAGRSAFASRVVVTAQHREMLDQVLAHFGIVPDWDLDIMLPRQSLTQITVRVLEGLEEVLARERPDLVLVHGDTTTTFAASLAAFYRKIPVGHVEAGLRTGRRYLPFPEEMNRCLTDRIAELHFAPTPWARDNLLREGTDPAGVHVTGNTAIDALLWTVGQKRPAGEALPLVGEGSRLLLVDAHRRENHGEPMRRICQAIRELLEAFPDVEVVFSVHRNPEVAEPARQILGKVPRAHLVDPMDYPAWAHLMQRAFLILSDSGGVQEEAPSLGVPVLLLREVTERPEALAAGTVRLVGSRREDIAAAASRLLSDLAARARMSRVANPYGDGRAAVRIADWLEHRFGVRRAAPEEFDPGQKEDHH